MRVGITDSGVGGLSVCAEVEALLRAQPAGDDLEILYLNAALRDDYAYNSMATRQEKLEAFDRFLRNVSARYRPDLLYIACNTLSILFRDPHFSGHAAYPVLGIVESGTQAMLSALLDDPDAALVVFATPTTVDEGTYARELEAAGVPAGRFVQQACPDLPDAISNDFSGGQAEALLRRYVPAALDRFERRPDRVVAFLGCTHYGYQAAAFGRLLAAEGVEARVLNPNQAAASGILDRLPPGSGETLPDIRFITPYPIPERPLRSLPHYLGDRAPATVSALRGFEHDPSLYDESGAE